MFLEEYIQQRWDKLPKTAKALLDLNDPQNRIVIKLLWEKQYWRERFEHLEKKVHHGCTGGFCKQCDPKEWKILSQQ